MTVMPYDETVKQYFKIDWRIKYADFLNLTIINESVGVKET